MLNLQQRIHIISLLQNYITSENPVWQNIKILAAESNPWFTPQFIEIALQNIANRFLDAPALYTWIKPYQISDQNQKPATIGITMAGNIPLAGFHDFLSCFISGHKQIIKLSSKDEILLKHMVDKMISWNGQITEYISFADHLKGCDAYIATGSNNTARYFEYYFKKYPHIIRKNRTSIAILKGNEPIKDLENLADDVCLYFGLGCRNVTKVYIPKGYDLLPLLEVFKKYNSLIENHKYKHNYDYNLAIHIMNQKYYMTNGSIIFSENPSVFSPISVLHYEFYTNREEIYQALNPEEIQCIAGVGKVALGTAQSPDLTDYADGIDTMLFLQELTGKQ